MKVNKTIIILLSTLGVFLLLYFTLTHKTERRYQWSENYRATSDQPYGTQFIKALLESYRPKGKFIFNEKKPLYELLDSAKQLRATDYVFIGQYFYLDADDEEALLNFIDAGNDAFIASTVLPLDLLEEIFVNECNFEIYYQQQTDSSVVMNFYHHALHTETGYTYTYRNGSKNGMYSWSYLSPEVFCEPAQSIIPLGYIAPESVNFVRFPYGNGNLYVHTNPLVFSNYFLTQPDKVEYVENVFSHLRGESIIWDELSKSAFAGNDGDSESSPLAYLLQYTSLKYAWWMMLGGTLLYTLFTAKRKQRVIPVLEEKANTSLEFVKMISALHFQNGNHLDIGRKKMKYFLHFIRAKYGLHAQNFTESHIKRLAEKSAVDVKDIQHIFDTFHQFEYKGNGEKAHEDLMKLYNAIEYFYTHCK